MNVKTAVAVQDKPGWERCGEFARYLDSLRLPRCTVVFLQYQCPAHRRHRWTRGRAEGWRRGNG